jgi:proline dehydrogenase
MINSLIAKILPLLPESLVWIFSKRYISGKYLSDALAASRKLNNEGFLVSVDLLGEYIHNLEEAANYKTQYIDLIERFTAESIDGHFSIKPSMFGLQLDREACYLNLRDILEVAEGCNSFIRIDMEDSQCTSNEIELFRRLKTEFPANVGLAIQAYMHRTIDDITSLLDLNEPQNPLNFRLCKGIYLEQPEIAYQKNQEIRDHYCEDLRFMLQNNIYVGIATHDRFLIEKAYAMITELNVSKDKVEFQMLFGVTPKLRQSILEKGHKVRVYVPYGKRWFGYSTRRLKENPSMIWHILKALIIRN